MRRVNYSAPLRDGEVVKHFKYDDLTTKEKKENKYLYKIIGTCIHSETKEKLMIYQALYYPYETYVRPYNMFMEEVDKEKYPNAKQRYRFELLEYSETRSALDRCAIIAGKINKITSEQQNQIHGYNPISPVAQFYDRNENKVTSEDDD